MIANEEGLVELDLMLSFNVDYRRSVMALAVLSTLIMVMGVAFSFYVFCNKRYTFKRLAAGIHFLTGIKARKNTPGNCLRI